MTTLTARAAFEAILDALNQRDLDALDALIHPDFEDVYPQSGERVRGIANLKAIITNYPGVLGRTKAVNASKGQRIAGSRRRPSRFCASREAATSSPASTGPSIQTARNGTSS